MLDFASDPAALRADVTRRVVDLYHVVQGRIRDSVHLPSVTANTARGVAYVCANMRGLPDRLAAELAGRPADEVRVMLEDAIRAALAAGIERMALDGGPLDRQSPPLPTEEAVLAMDTPALVTTEGALIDALARIDAETRRGERIPLTQYVESPSPAARAWWRTLDRLNEIPVELGGALGGASVDRTRALIALSVAQALVEMDPPA